MAEMNQIVKLAVDNYHGKVEKYTSSQANEALRQALIEANGGSTVLNYKAIRDGKCNGLFALIETILSRTVIEGLSGDEFFNRFVDFRNVAEGDQNLFLVENGDLYVVDEIANGTQAVRRQRLVGVTEAVVPTKMRAVRIYEELNRVLSGRVDFNEMINRVAESFRQKILNDIYSVWTTATAADLGGQSFFPTAGSYNEGVLLDTIAHVEAAAGGKTATIIGTKKAIRMVATSMTSEAAKADLNFNGYYGSFYGSPVIAMPQRHQVGSTNFVFSDKVLTIVAGDEKMIKFVYEGDPLVIMGNPTDNFDLTQEYFYGQKYGVGIVTAGGNSGIGRYEIV